VFLEEQDNVLHDRLVENGREGLGPVRGKRAQTRTFATRHHDSFHLVISSNCGVHIIVRMRQRFGSDLYQLVHGKFS
jgi:hypothetical protein